MIKTSYNYTSIKVRDKRIYSISGTKISSNGLSYSFLGAASFFLVIFNIVGVFLCFYTGKFLYNPIKSVSDVSFTFPIIFLGLPIFFAYIVNTVKIQNYKFSEYISLYFKPRSVYNKDGRVQKISNYMQNCLVRKIW